VGSNVKLGDTGLTIVGGPSVTSTGIDAGSKVIANVAPGVAGMRVGSAVFKGESAVGISFRRTSENNGWSVTGGVGMSRAGVAATVGAEWVFN
jgi:hypothetical protein